MIPLINFSQQTNFSSILSSLQSENLYTRTFRHNNIPISRYKQDQTAPINPSKDRKKLQSNIIRTAIFIPHNINLTHHHHHHLEMHNFHTSKQRCDVNYTQNTIFFNRRRRSKGKVQRQRRNDFLITSQSRCTLRAETAPFKLNICIGRDRLRSREGSMNYSES